MEALVSWELSFLHAIQDQAGQAWSIFWTLITSFGEAGIFWIALSLLLMIPKKTRKAGFSMGLALLLGVILGNGVLKNVVARPRPYDLDPTLSHLLAWGHMSTDFSFPSGHTLASFEAAVALLCHHKRWGIAALALAFLVGISRLCLLVHYPTDVIFGALMGSALALFSVWLVGLLWSKWEERKKA
jgi:undecaprenyl-diphosphatase